MSDLRKAGNAWSKLYAKALEAARAEKKAGALGSRETSVGLQAPAVVVPSGLNELKEAVKNKRGSFGAKRVERAADEIKNLERLYTTDALKEAFIGDNARALMTMNPSDFERYATPIPKGISGPQEFRGFGNQFHDESMKGMTLSDYLDNLANVKGGFADVPYLIINKEEQGLPLTPFISGHEGRHRNRALAKQGEEAGLVQLLPRSELREPFPRRDQEEYIEALRKELGMTDDLVLPQKYNEATESLFDKQIQRPAIKLPDIYADGGKVAKGIMGALAQATDMAKAEKAALKVKPPSDNIATVTNSNFYYPKHIGNQTLKVNDVSGGVRMSDPHERKRVEALAQKMSGPSGYISRIIVDHNNNVIEGQHRLEALRHLGIEDVPVYKIEDLSDTMPVAKMEEALNAVGPIHPDHAGQLVSYALEGIAEHGLEKARTMDYGKYQKFYEAALDAATPEVGKSDGGKITRGLMGALAKAKTMAQAERDANRTEFLEGSAAQKRLYHGTGSDIQEFDKSKIKRPMFGEGFHLAESPALASFYAGQFKEGQNVMPVHAAIKKPFELKDMSKWYDIPGNTDAEKTAWIKSQGYDGIKYNHGAPYNAPNESGTGWVAFEPNQIKSATGNRGTYDRSQNDINKADGGKIAKGVMGALAKAKQMAQAEKAIPAPIQRSIDQGYNHGWYHGTTGDIKSFDPKLRGESTNANSAKKGFFFARDPKSPPKHLQVKSNDPEAIELLRRFGMSEEDIAKNNAVSFEGHGSSTASDYAGLGGGRDYKEAMRNASLAKKRGDWDAYDKYTQEAEAAVFGERDYRQGLVAKHGDARDQLLHSIDQAFSYGRPEAYKNMSQEDLTNLDQTRQRLMPYSWYMHENAPFEKILEEASKYGTESQLQNLAKEIKNFKSVTNERRLADVEQGANVLPVALRYKNPYVHDFGGASYRDESYSDLIDRALAGDHDALLLLNTFDPGGGTPKMIDVGVVFEPNQIRSRFAQFDPKHIESSDILKKTGGVLHMADAGRVTKGIMGALEKARKMSQEDQVAQIVGGAARAAGMKAPVTATKDLTDLEDFAYSINDSIRQRSADMQNLVESMPYKYGKGQRVFTEDSARKNWPPLTVLGRTLDGNRIMRENPNDFRSKKIIDEATGKAKRTPYEPGYKVRLEHSPEDWSEFVIPESAILGNVDMADGGKVGRGIMGALTKAKEMAMLERKAALEASERALPMRLARAPAKSDAEIASHAERVGRQMLGEHVMSGKPGKTVNLAGRSMKENDRIKGVQYELKPTKDLPKSEVVEPRIGDVNVAFPGDYTLSDVELVSVNGRPIRSKQEGGSRYGQGKLDMEEPVFWASGEGPAQLAQDKITDSAHFFDPERVMAHHLAMGPVATNFAQHFADANLRGIDFSRMSKDDIDKFDKMIAAGYEKKNKKTGERQLFAFPEWPGIANLEESYEAMKADPELRKWFNSRMKTPKDTSASNLPNGLDTQWAITSPDLRNMEVNLTGHSVGEMVPEAALTDTANHNTYEKGIRGLYKGHQELLTPFALSFPDAAQHIASTQNPSDFTGTIQKVFPHQIVDQQHIDELGKYYEKLNKVLQGKKKDGGQIAKPKKPNPHSEFHRKMADGGYFWTDKDSPDNFLKVRHKAEGGDADDVSIKDIARNLGKLAKEQGKEELSSLKKPRAMTDIGNRGILAPALGAPVDLINMGLTGIDALSGMMGKPTRLASEKPFAGQEYFKDLMNEYGVTSGEDRPLMETTLSFFSPTGMIKGAQKSGEMAKKLPEFVRKIESGLGSMSKKHQ